jgi:cobalt-zinc-cadmium efflux system membrane fusion protein
MRSNFILLMLCVLYYAGTGCETKSTGSGKEETTSVSAGMHQMIVLTAEQYAQSEIATGTFTKQIIEEFLPATAEIVLGNEHTGTASTLTDGIVAELRVRLNQSVRKGEVVAILDKPGLLDLQQDYLERKDKIAFLKAEFDRYQSLSNENATAAKNLQRADAELREAQTSLALLAVKLRQFQIDPEKLTPSQVQTKILLRAPVSGTVTRINAAVGSTLGPGNPVCEIADYSKIQPVIYIFEKDISRIRPGAKALLHFPSDPARTFPATILSLDGAMDKTRKALRAFAKFDRPSDNFPTGAYMEARVAPVSGTESSVLPQEAVVRENEGEFIFILQKETKEGFLFHKVAVKTGAADNGFISVTPLEQIPPNPKIVVKGAYYVSAQGSGIEVEE